jgi:hypothetical protein
MQNALFDKDRGYYCTKNPIGKNSDFITAPEISQVFGELVAAYFLQIFALKKTSISSKKIAFVEPASTSGYLLPLKTLKEKLDKANCIQIESGEPAKIGFQRSGMGMYSFNVFDNPIPDSLRNNYNDSCTYIMATDRLVLEYGGGAVGSQCFYNKK